MGYIKLSKSLTANYNLFLNRRINACFMCVSLQPIRRTIPTSGPGRIWHVTTSSSKWHRRRHPPRQWTAADGRRCWPAAAPVRRSTVSESQEIKWGTHWRRAMRSVDGFHKRSVTQFGQDSRLCLQMLWRYHKGKANILGNSESIDVYFGIWLANIGICLYIN